ncbi:hypothetical protein CHS0354_028651 [Potamilus streckersoni]|uniref:HTH psq-type domain-containing protein n=1 Tax=Potamilus streckersoni TaxID=2493646 RepID=A0AAE0W3V2_9BIVA|nr:hypothetical protein CHS0354_028651 [Potamilus streckersoni]
MPPKRSATSMDSGSEPKRQRSMLTIKEKIELLDMLKEGRWYAAFGRHYGINVISRRRRQISDTDTIRTKAKQLYNCLAEKRRTKMTVNKKKTATLRTMMMKQDYRHRVLLPPDQANSVPVAVMFFLAFISSLSPSSSLLHN